MALVEGNKQGMTWNPANKRIAVIGMARSGLAAADVLASRGAMVTLYDGKPASQLAEALLYAEQRGIVAQPGSEKVGAATELVITSPGVRREAPVLLDAQARQIPIWGEIEAAYRLSPAPILAITGTNGKTTTTALLGEIMRRAGIKTFVAGNIAAGDIALPLIRAADAATAEDVIVAEISSFQLEWIEAFRPQIAAITNISVDHSDRQNWDEYVDSKWRIFENQTHGDTAVLRSDIPAPSMPYKRGQGEVVYFDRLAQPDWLHDIKLPGAHNRENVMAALAMARSFGIADSVIQAAALEFSGVVHRMEPVAEIGGVQWINNSMCTNNDAFARSLAAIETRKIILSGGVYKGGDTSVFAEAAAQPSVAKLIVYGHSAGLLADAARAAGAWDVEMVSSLAEAVQLASLAARPRDTVLLSPACASFDQFRDFEDRGDQFKSMVRDVAARPGSESD